jgi:cyanophycin synthetase
MNFFISSLYKLEQRASKLNHSLNPEVRRAHRHNKKRSAEFYSTYWEQIAKNIGAQIESLGYGYLRLHRDNKSTIVNRYYVMLDDHLSLRILGNKPLTYRLLTENNIPVPRHLAITSDQRSDANDFLTNCDTPIVVKPAMNTGSGRGITTGVSTSKSLGKAINRASVYGDHLLLEEQLELNSYRLILLNGELLHAVHRAAPSVTGDGKQTIDQLVDTENNKRINSESIRSLSLITKDAEYKSYLASKGQSTKTVLAPDEMAAVKNVVNQNNRFENHSIDPVHPEIVALCTEICRTMGIVLAGVDIMATSLQNPPTHDFYINEVNTTPGLHHHSLVSDTNSEHKIGEKILNHILS